MRVSEIFLSIEGEGIRTGAPSVFVRLFGCNLRCSYCDSMYSVEGDSYREMSVEEIVNVVKSYKTHNVTVTGGEPLIHNNVRDLLRLLDQSGFEVNVETNGTQTKVPGLKNVFYTTDWKSPSSGMHDKMAMSHMMELSNRDVLKFVVGSVEDLEDAALVVESLATQYAIEKRELPTFYVSPIFNTMPYETMVQWILSNENMRRNRVRFQVQLHKMIWDPDARGV